MSAATAKRPTVTNCRLCGQPFPHRLLTEFEGIEVWERRYCTDCASARIMEENAWEANRQKNTLPAEIPDELLLGPQIREFAVLREDLERYLTFDAGLSMVFERAYLKDAIKVTATVDELLVAFEGKEIANPAGLLHHRLRQIHR